MRRKEPIPFSRQERFEDLALEKPAEAHRPAQRLEHFLGFGRHFALVGPFRLRVGRLPRLLVDQIRQISFVLIEFPTKCNRLSDWWEMSLDKGSITCATSR